MLLRGKINNKRSKKPRAYPGFSEVFYNKYSVADGFL